MPVIDPSRSDHPCKNRWHPSKATEKALPLDTPNDSPTTPALPDRLSTDPRSPHHVAAVFEHGVGIRFNGAERFDVSEYCISEGWIKVAAGKSVDRRGQPLTIKLKGKVEAFPR